MKNSVERDRYRALGSSSSEEETGAVIDLIREGYFSKNALVEMMSERHPVYRDRPGYQANRIKGYAMASFLNVGLAGSAEIFVLDELQNGKSAYLVAAAARALRGAKRPGAHYAYFLLQALDNIRNSDDSMTFDVFKPSWPLEQPTTAKTEIFLTFQWLKGYAKEALPELRSFLDNPYDFNPDIREDIKKTIHVIESDRRKLNLTCCVTDGKEQTNDLWNWKAIKSFRDIYHLQVENEKGVSLKLTDILNNKPTIVAFFYTRCMNPNKCTLTINKLGWLQKKLEVHGFNEQVNLLAFTYDPGYDTPGKMQVFGENRGLTFGPNVHMLRTRPEDFARLSDFFKLGVNQVTSTVNQHRLELFLLDQNGNIRISYTRLQWEVGNVLADIESLLKRPKRHGWIFTVIGPLQQVVFPVILAFFPKCPFCWAIYLSAFGVSGLKSIPYSPWLIPWIILAIAINLAILYRVARVRNGLAPFWISLVGGLIVIVPGYLFSSQTCSISGVALMFIGASLNSLPYRQWSKLHHLVSVFFRKIKRTPAYFNAN